MSFSASRTANIALYATSWTTAVGVDIEAIRTNIDLEGMAARFLSTAEQHALASLPPGQRLAAFFQCWTRKEAYVKGIGTGLSFPLRDVDVWDAGHRPASVSGWSVHQVDVAPGFAAAVAVAGLGDWVPQAPRRLAALGLSQSCQQRPARSPTGLVAPSG